MRKLLILIFIVFFSCNNTIKIDQNEKNEFENFNQLPDTVKYFMKKFIEEKELYPDSIFTFSINQNIRFQHIERPHNNWLNETRNFYEKFKVGNELYQINGNLEDPFIYYNDKIYFPDYNTYKNNYSRHKYYSINLSPVKRNFLSH